MTPDAAALTDLAATAATHWGGRVVRLLSHRENAVFEMAVPTGRAALRLHRMNYQNAAAIRSELWWCAALAQAGVRVPAALPGRDGTPLIRLPNGGHASAIAWFDGRAIGAAGQGFDLPLAEVAARHRDLGHLLAQFHAASDRLTLPADFTRPHWDIAGLVGPDPLWGRFWDHPAASPDQTRSLHDARDHLRHWLPTHAATGDFGLIHADVLRENVWVQGRDLGLIDFDDAGYGYRQYDLGTALCQSLDEPDFPALRDALIAGYGETRAVSQTAVEAFILARVCASVGWLMPRVADDAPVVASHIDRAVRWARALGL